jgi:uncharacterized protein (DUF4415 family)
MRRKPLTDREGEVRELTRNDIRRFRPASQVLPPQLLAVLPRRRRGQRGPQKAPTKRQVTLRLDSDLVAFFKTGGAGWQTRINAFMRKALPRAG